jgi:hydrogenase-4 component B
VGAVNEWLVIVGIALAALSGVPGLAMDRGGRAGERWAALTMVAAAVCAIAGALRALVAPETASAIRLVWEVPGGAFHLEVDALSAMFVIQVFGLAALGSIYGLDYWSQAEHRDDGRKLRAAYGLMVAGMALLGVARNVVLFMAGWELMAIGAFLTITTEDREARVRDVGYLYLIATRVATLCVIGAFALLMAAPGGGTEIDGQLDAATPIGTAIFVLAFIGCGLKAGLMPLHVWLPGAHANAPSHVSALMSGALIKMGIYGLLRFTSLFPHPPMWWGGAVLFIGLVSGVLGVAFAIGQHDLKRLLAYHSVENIGIICMGIGIALLGRAAGRPELVGLGLAGGLLHVWNHGLFKGLLFLCAGNVVHATGTREIDHLGGLARRMRWTALGFVVGAVAICGLPPLNGFVSELLVYLGFLDVASTPTGSLWLVGALSVALLALVGALAIACFVKVLGAVFLGEPRSREASEAHEATRRMLGPMAALAALCVAIGLGAPLVAPALDHAVAAWAPELAPRLRATDDVAPLTTVALLYAPLCVLAALGATWLVRRIARAPTNVGTWDCGYAAPSARMQYTSSSFAQMLVGTFAWALRPDVRRPRIAGPFPAPGGFHSHVPDTVLDRLLVPATRTVDEQRRWVTWMQRGKAHSYLLYILVTLVVLLLWKGG